MGGGDLNLKKSWHPGLMKNQERVWKEEKAALAERKKVEELRREREEEAAWERLNNLNDNGQKRVDTRVSWMYNGPSSGTVGTTEEAEAYLLGKRRIDQLLKQDNSQLQKGGEVSAPAGPTISSVRDTASKVRQDPMFAMHQREQAALEAVMKDPVRRQKLLDAAGVGEKKSHSEERHKRHYSRRHHDDRREHRSSRHRHHHDRDYDDYDDENRSRHHHRSHRHHRRREYTPSTSRSPPPRARRSSASRRSASPVRSRSRTPPPRDRFRARSPPARELGMDRSPARGSRSARSPPPRDQRRRPSPPPRERRGERARDESRTDEDDERARRLAAMQADAAQMNAARAKRVEETTAKEEAERAKDDQMRSERGRFVSGLHTQKQNLDLGESLRRTGGGRSAVEV